MRRERREKREKEEGEREREREEEERKEGRWKEGRWSRGGAGGGEMKDQLRSSTCCGDHTCEDNKVRLRLKFLDCCCDQL